MGPKLVLLGLMLACSWLSGPLMVFGITAVTHLPGFDGRLPFELETGYVAVGEAEDVNLFYYFAKSERTPEEDPLLLWFIGGPGCSGLSALAFEIGPFGFDLETFEIGKFPRLVYREDSWTRISSVIFVDAPAGSGFSYSKGPEMNEWVESKSADNLHQFVRKWLLDHPQFVSNPFYIAGNSYGGKMVPIVAQKIILGNDAGEKPHVNIKGYLVGNAATGEKQFDSGFKIPWARGMGLISDELYEDTKSSCRGDYLTTHSTQCLKCLETVEEDLKDLNEVHILEPKCDSDFRIAKISEHRTDRSLVDFEVALKMPTRQCRSYGYLATPSWANDDRVKEALGVDKGWTGEWTRCPADLRKYYTLDIPSAIPYHLNITSGRLRVLVYSGDHDLVATFLGTQAWLRSLNHSIIDDWRPWWVDGQVAGYTETYANNLTYATIKGAGHTASEYKPVECRSMFERWVSGEAL